MSSGPLPTLVLASASPSRRRILESAGIGFEVLASDIEETWDVAAPPAQIVVALARAKAEEVARRRLDAVVLGCDSLFELDGVALGKPYTPERAIERWRSMSGRSGLLHTGHALIHRGRVVEEVISTVVTFSSPNADELDHYVASGEPLEVAGAFTLEGRSAAFIDRVEGDAANVQGLSVAALRRLLALLELPIHRYWR